MMAIKQYDLAAFERMYDQYAGALYNIIVKEIGDNEAAHCIFENTFSYIFLHVHEHDSSLSLLFTWMRKVAHVQVRQYISVNAGAGGLSEI